MLSQGCAEYVDVYEEDTLVVGETHAEVDAASLAQRILSGEGAGRLWWQVAMDLLQQAYFELRHGLWVAQ